MDKECRHLVGNPIHLHQLFAESFTLFHHVACKCAGKIPVLYWTEVVDSSFSSCSSLGNSSLSFLPTHGSPSPPHQRNKDLWTMVCNPVMVRLQWRELPIAAEEPAIKCQNHTRWINIIIGDCQWVITPSYAASHSFPISLFNHKVTYIIVVFHAWWEERDTMEALYSGHHWGLKFLPIEGGHRFIL